MQCSGSSITWSVTRSWSGGFNSSYVSDIGDVPIVAHVTVDGDFWRQATRFVRCRRRASVADARAVPSSRCRPLSRSPHWHYIYHRPYVLPNTKVHAANCCRCTHLTTPTTQSDSRPPAACTPTAAAQHYIIPPPSHAAVKSHFRRAEQSSLPIYQSTTGTRRSKHLLQGSESDLEVCSLSFIAKMGEKRMFDRRRIKIQFSSEIFRVA